MIQYLSTTTYHKRQQNVGAGNTMERSTLTVTFGDKVWKAALTDEMENIENARLLLEVNGIESQPVGLLAFALSQGVKAIIEDNDFFYLMVREYDFPDALGILRHAIINNPPVNKDTLAHLKELGT